MSDAERLSPAEPQLPVYVLQDFINNQRNQIELGLELIDGTNDEVDLAFIRADAREECLMELTHLLRGDGIPVEWEPNENNTPDPTTELPVEALVGAVRYFGAKCFIFASMCDDAENIGSPEFRKLEAKKLEARNFLMDFARELGYRGLETGLNSNQT